MEKITQMDIMVEAYCRKVMDSNLEIESKIINAEKELESATNDLDRKTKTQVLENIKKEVEMLEQRAEGFEDAVQAMGIDLKEFHRALLKIYG